MMDSAGVGKRKLGAAALQVIEETGLAGTGSGMEFAFA
jgi:hypothetical protein